MNNFLTTEKREKMDKIVLDYVFFRPREFIDRTIYRVSSRADKVHSTILLKFAEKGIIPDDYEIMSYLYTGDFLKAMDLYVMNYQDMIVQVPRFKNELGDTTIIYAPEVLNEQQKVIFRLWDEYVLENNSQIMVREWKKNGSVPTIYEDKNEVLNYLEDKKIRDDELVRKLVLKYPEL